MTKLAWEFRSNGNAGRDGAQSLAFGRDLGRCTRPTRREQCSKPDIKAYTVEPSDWPHSFRGSDPPPHMIDSRSESQGAGPDRYVAVPDGCSSVRSGQEERGAARGEPQTAQLRQ